VPELTLEGGDKPLEIKGSLDLDAFNQFFFITVVSIVGSLLFAVVAADVPTACCARAMSGNESEPAIAAMKRVAAFFFSPVIR